MLRAQRVSSPVCGLAPANPARQRSGLTISGSVLRADGTRVANVRLRLRNVDKGTILAQTVSDQNGAFSLPVTDPGLYVVEAVGEDGSVLAVSSALQSTTTPLTTNVILPQTSRQGRGLFLEHGLPSPFGRRWHGHRYLGDRTWRWR